MKLHQQMYYFEVAKVLPKKEDADQNGFVLGFIEPEGWDVYHWCNLKLFNCTHWMQLPKAPSDSDPHAFLE